jgi:hypothetical protein
MAVRRIQEDLAPNGIKLTPEEVNNLKADVYRVWGYAR